MTDVKSTRLTKAQALVAFLEEERAGEIDILTAAMTREQHIAALAAKGISRAAQAAMLERQREKLRAVLAKQPAPRNVVPIRSDLTVVPPGTRRRWSLRDLKVGGLAASLATAATLVMGQLTAAAPEVLPVLATASAPPRTPAAEMRLEAYELCDRRAWQACLDALDRAKTIDPSGDELATPRAARSMAMKFLHR